MPAVFIDLDRTLLRHASGQALSRALFDEGLATRHTQFPGQSLLYSAYDLFGENALSMALARAGVLAARGWSQEATITAAKRAVPDLVAQVAPFAPQRLAAFKNEGLSLVLATTTPHDLVAPLAEELGFDDVIATRYNVDDGHYTGGIDGPFCWGMGKLAAVKEWATLHDIDLASCHACSDSVFDLPLLSAVGTPHPVNPDPRLLLVSLARRWHIEHWDRPDGIPSLLGLEPFELLKPWLRPEAFPYAHFEITGVENIPATGPVIVASNHRSYFDMPTLALLAAKLTRPVRALAKKEMFSLPVVGAMTRSIGGIPVDRKGAPEEAFREATSCLEAGELVIILPQGTIPRGEAFFDPVLRGKTGAARLAAATGAPIIPVGIWGTEIVWPRSQTMPTVTTIKNPPTVRVTVGCPVTLSGLDIEADTKAVMAAISDLLPDEARRASPVSQGDVAKTYPSGVRPPTSAEVEPSS